MGITTIRDMTLWQLHHHMPSLRTKVYVKGSVEAKKDRLWHVTDPAELSHTTYQLRSLGKWLHSSEPPFLIVYT